MSDCKDPEINGDSHDVGKLNVYNKKEMVIEVSALLAATKESMTAAELNALFKEIVGFDFPTSNFHRNGNFEDFLCEQREFKLTQLEPVRKFRANLEFKYILLHQKAKHVCPETIATVKRQPAKKRLTPADNDTQKLSSRFAAAEITERASDDTRGRTMNRSFSKTPDSSDEAPKVPAPVYRSVFASPERPKESVPVATVKVPEVAKKAATDKKEENAVAKRREQSPKVEKETDKCCSLDDCVKFLDLLFGGVGCSVKSRFLVPQMRAVVDANPGTFRVEGENENEVVILKKEIGQLKKPGDLAIATMDDLMWLTKETCVVNRAEPYDVCRILYIFPSGGFICGSVIGTEPEGRMPQISELLRQHQEKKDIELAGNFNIGGLYVAAIGEYLARIILLEETGTDVFKAISIDYPYIVDVKPEELFEVPEAFTLSHLPGNLYLASLRTTGDFNKAIEQRLTETIQMVFFGDMEGVRMCDWVTEDNTWFSIMVSGGTVGDGPLVDKAIADFDIRELSKYFTVKNCTDVLKPYTSRPAASPAMFRELYDTVNSLYMATESDEEKKELIRNTETLATALIMRLCVADDDIPSAVFLFRSINVALTSDEISQ